MRQEFCLNHSSGLNAQNVLSRILDQVRLTGGLPKPVFLAFLSVTLICVSRSRGHDAKVRLLRLRYFYFSPRAHVGRDDLIERHRALSRISIHAPAWGATFLQDGFSHLRPNFNPRARVGRDPRHQSIPHVRFNFNPRARVGRDGKIAMDVVVQLKFQSTRPRGARHDPHAEPLHLLSISIHAPTWGATNMMFNRLIRDIFQSTRPRGARPLVRQGSSHAYADFNPRGARRGV